MRRRWPSCEVLLYGSALSELATPTSDLDLCLSLPNDRDEAHRDELTLNQARDALTALGKKVRPRVFLGGERSFWVVCVADVFVFLCCLDVCGVLCVWQSPAVVSLLVSMDSVASKLPKKRDAVGRTRNLFLRAKAELDYAETNLAQLTALQVDEATDPAAAARVARQKEEVGRQLLRLRKEMTHAQARATEAETALSKALKAQEDVEEKLKGMPREQVDEARALRAKVVDAERWVTGQRKRQDRPQKHGTTAG